jgi:ABC-2 type transport system permease protein
MRLLLHQLRIEQLLFWRSREAAIFIFAFPIMLFLLLGSVYQDRLTISFGRFPSAEVLLGGMIGYGAANTAFAGIAITLVIRREEGILKRLRATPLPVWALIGALLLSTLAVFVLETIALFALGRLSFGTPMPGHVASLLAAIVLSSACFAALGIATASLLRSSQGASAAVNVILLPMAFVSGSFGPTRHLPAVLRAIGYVLPLKYAIRLVDAVYLGGQEIWSQPTAIAVLLAWGVGGAVVALTRFQWEPRDA